MFEIKCSSCGEEYYITGITEEKYKELCQKNPDYCDECGEKIL